MIEAPKIVEIKRRESPPPASLSSWVLTTIGMAYSAELKGLLSYVEWSGDYQPLAYANDPSAKAMHGNNVWDWYFEQPHRVMADAKRNETWHWAKPVPEYLLSDRFHHDVLYSEPGSSVVPRLFRPNETVKTYAAKLLSKYGLTPDSTIAVSCRATDMGYDGRHATPISNFFPVIDALTSRYPTFKIWVQTDDTSAKDSFQSKYPKAIYVDDFFTSPRKDTFSDNVSPKSGYERGLDVAAMILMLSYCKVLAKNTCNIVNLASLLSKGEIIDVM